MRTCEILRLLRDKAIIKKSEILKDGLRIREI